jgi:hypothetical protein
MKKLLLLIAAFVLIINAQMNAQTITISGDISSNTTWTNTNTYLLSGFVYVTNNAILTIEPGTIIKGDKASKGSLIITRGAKIIADGTVSQPIVFTSNEPAGFRTYGDWGGIILCGNAPINDPAGEKVIEGGVDAVKGLYGGNNPADNSGILRYVRIEFPGIAFMPNNEINGLTCGGVGNGTIIDYIQVSFSGDDSYENFGGNVNMKHVIAFRGLDDDFDSDFGYSGKCQFLISVRDSNVADVSGSNGFESDNDATGSTNNPITHPVYSNVTESGPMIDGSTMINANYKRGAHLRRSTKTSIYNSAIAGYPVGLLIDGSNSENSATNNELMFRSNIIAGCTTPLSVASGSTFDINAWFNQPGFNNSVLPNTTDLMLTNPFDYNMPDVIPVSGSPLLSNADFSYTDLSDPFFDVVSFRGAIGINDWTASWVNYDCQNTSYTTGMNELSEVKSISVYPNPSRGIVYMNIDLIKSSALRAVISDMNGTKVFEENLGVKHSGKEVLTLNTENLSRGFYTLQIISESGVKSIKLTVL